jgi:hypothetical protein
MRTHTWLVGMTLTWSWEERRGNQQKSTAMWMKTQFSRERGSVVQKHIWSLNILRTQSPNSCARFSSRFSGVVIFSFKTPLLCMVSCFLIIFRVHPGSFSDCVEPQITESQGQWGPGHPWPGRWDSPLYNPVAVRLGIVDIEDMEVRAGKNYPVSPHVHPVHLIPWTTLSLCAQSYSWEFSLFTHLGAYMLWDGL